MTQNMISNLIKSVCLQIIQTIIMNVVMNNFLPNLSKLFKYINCLGLIKILIYLLCTCVLFYIIYKLFKLLKNFISGSSLKSDKSSKSYKSSNLIFNKNINNINSDCISSFESKSSDFDLEQKKKIIHKSSSSSKIKNHLKKKIKNLINSEILLSSY